MLTRTEYNELYRLIEAYTDAWETYVAAVAVADSVPKTDAPQLGMKVTETKEELLKYVKEKLA